MSARRAQLSADQPRVYDEAVIALIDRRFVLANGFPVSDRDADEALLRIVSTALRLRLAALRGKGLSGWHAPGGVSSERLVSDLKGAAARGDMLDVIVIAAKLHIRAHLHGPEA